MRFWAGIFFLLLTACWWLPAQLAKATELAPGGERLTYNVEWRLIHAGTVTVEHNAGDFTVRLESAGIVSTLFKVNDTYTAHYDETGCALSSVMDSLEGKNHRDTRVTFDRTRNHAFFIERDVNKDSVIREAGTDIPNCVLESIGALKKLRVLKLDPGQTMQLPVSDGRRSASVRIGAEEREDVKTSGTLYHTMRYHADLLNGVVYSRKGRLLLWISNDERRLPVQIQLRMSFPIGTVTLQLDKEEHT